MAVTNVTDIADLVQTTQSELGPGKWTDLACNLQEYVALPQILTEKKVGFMSGNDIRWRVRKSTSGNARKTGAFSTDTVNIRDTFTEAVVPWRHIVGAYGIERREILVNRNPARIVDLVEARRSEAYIDIAILIEDMFWNGVASASSDEDIYNVNYWITYNASEGFNGAEPSGHSTVAGISTSSVSAWKNWTANLSTWTAGANTTANITKLRQAYVKTKFKSPVSVPQFDMGEGRGIYTNYDVIAAMESYAEDQNQNLGRDIASMDGQVLFRRLPVQWVPQLDSNADDPVYGIDWSQFRPVFLEGDYMHETVGVKSATDHNTVHTFIDCTWNIACYSRRNQFVLALGDPAS